MKHKRKIINKYLSQFNTVKNDTGILYLDKDNIYKIRFMWLKKLDTYVEINVGFKSYTLKQFHFYIKRLNRMKAFW